MLSAGRAKEYPPRAPRRLVLEVGERQALGLGDAGERDRRVAVGLAREMGEHADAVLGLGREHHPVCSQGESIPAK
jgi:hypothetical protein